MEALEQEKENLQLRIEKERLGTLKISAEFMTYWLQRFRKLDITEKVHRRVPIGAFVNAVYVYDDKLLICFTSMMTQPR